MKKQTRNPGAAALSPRLCLAVIVTALATGAAGFLVGQAVGQNNARVEDIFSDVGTNHPHRDGIQWAYDNALMGAGLDEFRPGQAVTRGQLATILRRYHALPEATAPAPSATSAPVVTETTRTPSPPVTAAPLPPTTATPTTTAAPTAPAVFRARISIVSDEDRTVRVEWEPADIDVFLYPRLKSAHHGSCSEGRVAHGSGTRLRAIGGEKVVTIPPFRWDNLPDIARDAGPDHYYNNYIPREDNPFCREGAEWAEWAWHVQIDPVDPETKRRAILGAVQHDCFPQTLWIHPEMRDITHGAEHGDSRWPQENRGGALVNSPQYEIQTAKPGWICWGGNMADR